MTTTTVNRGMAEAKALEQVTERLLRKFDVAPEVVEAAVTSALATYAGRPIRDFVPVLVEREAIERLRMVRSPRSS